MKTEKKLWLLSVIAALLCGHATVSFATNRDSKPNVLFIAVDDLRPELGCYGVKEIKTPEMDSLAASGVTFNRAYCQLAVCNPSRVSLMTGLRPDSSKVWDLVTRFRQTVPDVVTLPQQFKKHGYYAVSYGKIFHNPWPDDVSWSEPHRWPEKSSLWSDEAKQRHAACKERMRAEGQPQNLINRIRAQATEIVDVPDNEHIDGAIAQQALTAMQRLAKQDQPFFLAAGFVRPHLPFVVPRRYWDLYAPEKISAAANPMLPSDAPRFAMNTMYELRDYLDFVDTPTPDEGSLSEAQQRRLKHGYYASVSFVDALVGRLLVELDSLGLADNTIVVLWGDHGWKLGEHNSWCKQTNYVPPIGRRPQAIFRNRGEEPLTLFWITPDGEEQEKGVIQPGKQIPQSSTIGHRFRVRGPDGFSKTFEITKQREIIEIKPEPTTTENGEERRPNIVFAMADDWSWPHAGILGDPVVKTPNFDRIVRQGVLFENAFVSTPSCTPSRLSILSGQHHWRLKEGDSLGGSLREEYDVYTELLQKAGYRIGRFGKGVWPSKHTFRKRDSFGERFDSFDEFIKDRKPDEPFCYWHGGQDPHRPYELAVGVQSGVRLSEVNVPACLPDNETVRSDVADYLWEVHRFDGEVGEIMARLEAMGELENTIIVVSGDNGMPFPRCKATLYDLGTRVPLAIRWGERVVGQRKVTDFVSLCDLAPTFLEAARLKPSRQMTGRSLMPLLASKKSGQIDPARVFVLTGMEQHVYSYPSRALRTTDFLYIRNFDPRQWPTGEVDGHNPTYDFASEPWPTESGAFSFNIDPSPSKQFLRLHRNDEDTKRFAALAFLRHPDEELYDLQKDPDQLNNVADDADYAKTRRRLRQKLDAELFRSDDPRLAIDGYQSRVVEGWPMRINDKLLTKQAEPTEAAVQLLEGQLRTVNNSLPSGILDQLRDIPIWMSPPYQGDGPAAAYHANVEWLRDNGRIPELARCVEITNVAIFEEECRRMPMTVMHELAHAYHDQILGFDRPEVNALYERACKSGKYDAVRCNNGETVRAYAMTNEKEYFAETSEAFFGTNDVYPFNRQQLWTHDPEMFDLLARLWQVGAAEASIEWPQYRGHQANGVSDYAATPTHWDVETGENILWQTEIPGLANSAPIVWGDRIYVTTARTEAESELNVSQSGIDSIDDDDVHQWYLLAIDKATGKVVFNEVGYEGQPRVKRHIKSTHCNSTPATDGTHIVTIFGSEGLFCFDMQGRLQWKKDLGPMDSGYFKVPEAQWGFASSPVIHEGKVVVLCDVQEDSFLAVFDLADGREVWRRPRSDVPTWGTPTIVKHDGRTQILVNGWHHTGAYEFETGEEIWKLDGGGDIPVPTPVIAHGNAYFTSSHGDFRPMRAIRLGAIGDITPPGKSDTNEAVIWIHDRKGNYMQTPVVVGKDLYGCQSKGIMTCYDAESGEIRYTERLPGGGFTASPVSDGKHVYFTSESGKVCVVPAGGPYSLVATNELADYCLATPAISEGTLLFRTQHKLIAVKARE